MPNLDFCMINFQGKKPVVGLRFEHLPTRACSTAFNKGIGSQLGRVLFDAVSFSHAASPLFL